MKLPNDQKTQSPNCPSVVFFGSSSYVLPILEVLRKNFDLELVITTEHPALQGEALRTLQPPVINYCITNKIPYLSATSLSDPNLQSSIFNLQSSVAVLADFRLIIPTKILKFFPYGIVNIHPSLLPKYRGPTPVQTAILNGEKTTGVSIIKLDNEIDHGPILGQEKAEILPTDTAGSLYKRLFEIGANLLLKILPDYLNDNLKPIPQNHKDATFTQHLTRQDGFIDISSPQLKIKNLKLKIRAHYPWPGTWLKTEINGKEKIIKLLPNLPITQQPNDPILIQVEGKKPMSYQDFLNGYKEAKNILEKLNLTI